MRRILALALLLLAAAPARATFTLTVSTTGPNSALSVVTSTPSGIVCPPTCSAAFFEQSTITVGEVSASTVAFVGWAGAQGCLTNAQSCDFPLTANADVTAAFDPILDISFSTAPADAGIGVVTSSGGVSCASTGTCANGAVKSLIFPMGTQVVLVESTGTASAFTGWTGDGGCNTASTCTITLNGYEHIVATFTAVSTPGISSFTIAVAIPNGGGAVTSTPAGINCSSTSTACAFAFASGTSVKLTTAAANGYRFAGWANGGCSGGTACVITSTSPLQGTGLQFSPAAYFYKKP